MQTARSFLWASRSMMRIQSLCRFHFYHISRASSWIGPLNDDHVEYFPHQCNRSYLKLMPYFFVTCGEWMDATDSNNGTSFADRLSADVTAFSEQNSVASKNAASVSDCKYISCNFDSMNDMHCLDDVPADHMTCTVSSIVDTNWDMPTEPAAPTTPFPLARANDCDDINLTSLLWVKKELFQKDFGQRIRHFRTNHLSTLAMMAMFSVGICSNAAQCEARAKFFFKIGSHTDGDAVVPCGDWIIQEINYYCAQSLSEF